MVNLVVFVDLADRALHMLQAVLTDGTMAALIDHICKYVSSLQVATSY